MEIIGEVILQILGWILRLFGELILQAIFELLAELIGHSLKEPFRRPEPVNPWLAAIGYLIFGAVGGAISIWAFPTLFIVASWLRVVNLFLTPIVAGILMAYIGAWRQRRGKETIRLDSFFYGFCFAFSMALVRFVWGQ